MDDTCPLCRDARSFECDFTFAFQPIVHVLTGEVFAYEALVRGPSGEPANTILSEIEEGKQYAFDQAARTKAVELAARLMPDSDARLSINIMPNAIYDPVRCLRTTLKAARENNFSLNRLMFEATEHERVTNTDHLARIVNHYSLSGFTMAIDDFGAGYAGLALLAEFRPDIVKLDMMLLRDIDGDPSRQAIVNHLIAMLRALNVEVIAEGVETAREFRFLAGAGVDLMQGYFFARPLLEGLPELSDASKEEMARLGPKVETSAATDAKAILEVEAAEAVPLGVPARDPEAPAAVHRHQTNTTALTKIDNDDGGSEPSIPISSNKAA